MSDAFLIFCSCGSPEEAEKLASVLVDERLAACVNIVHGIHSVYRWNDKIETATEFLLIIKSAADRLAEIQSRLETLHSYDTPEVIAIPIVAGSPKYLAWLRRQIEA
jgi:periplasmic divalent cation tolerance protein